MIDMIRLDDGCFVDVAYSSDDGGWYAQRHDDDRVTDIFPDRETLASALAEGSADWNA